MPTSTALRPPAKVGVGMSYLPSRPDLTEALLSTVDYVELSPEVFVTEVFGPDVLGTDVLGTDVFGTGTQPRRAVLDQAAARQALDLVGNLPVVLHGLELSIGSAHGWNEHALDALDGFLALRDAPWHSEHLNFLSTMAADGTVVPLGLPLPLPFTAECAELVGARANAVIARYGRPFLLENSANYLPDLPADPGWDEATFLTALTERSDCWLLLDLFNLWTNCVNHRLDPIDLLNRMPLHRVVEVHLAGGEERDGLLLDSHSAEVPGPVWELLRRVLDQAPALAGITVEVLDLYAEGLGAQGIRAQLERAREFWEAR